MTMLVGRRIVAMVPVLALVSLIVFSMISLVPGDPATTLAGESATAEQIVEIRARLGLDDPIPQQYVRWAGGALRGDFGTSLFSSQGVTDAIVQRLPVTISLAGGAIAVTLLLGVPGGLVAAVRRGRWPDRAISLGAALALAMPSYFIGMLLVLVFAIWAGWLPGTSYVRFGDSWWGWMTHLLLPCLTLGLSSAAVVVRQLRSSMIGVLTQDYVRTARAKGLRTRSVIGKHTLKNAAIPAVTALGTQVSFLLGGSVIVEQVFGIAGVGNLAVAAVLKRDLPVIQGVVMLTALAVLVCNLFVDIAYGFLNPKVRAR